MGCNISYWVLEIHTICIYDLSKEEKMCSKAYKEINMYKEVYLQGTLWANEFQCRIVCLFLMINM